MKISFVDVRGTRTRYLHQGSGPPLVLIHGIGLSGDSFYPVIDALAAKFTVFAPDILGHGFTDSVAYGEHSPLAVMTAHLVGWVDALGLDRYVVGGSSYGALLAALNYFARPDRIDKLVLIGSGSVFHPEQGRAASLRAALANGSTAMLAPTLASVRKRLENICADPASVPSDILLSLLTCYGLPDRYAAYKATIDGLLAPCADAPEPVHDRLEAITVPALVITGREDSRASWQLTARGVQRMPDARLIIYERCGHLPYCEHPAQFAGDVIAFAA